MIFIKHIKGLKRKTLVIISLIILVIGFGLYTVLKPSDGETRYIVANASRGDILTTISGSGQISASSQVEVSSKVSGEIKYLNTPANGTKVTKGTLIAQVDTRDALISLENAEITYAKATKEADEIDILKAESELDTAITDNAKAYEDAFTEIVNVYSDFPEIIEGMNDILYGRDGYLQTENIRSVGQVALEMQKNTSVAYDKPQSTYNKILLNEFKTISRTSSSSTLESFTDTTYKLVYDISEALKQMQATVEHVRSDDSSTSGDTVALDVTTWSSTINSYLSKLKDIQSDFITTKQSMLEKKAALVDLKDGVDELDARSAQLTLLQKQYDYQNYFIRAPFDGLLAKLSVRPTDSVNNGTVVATIVSAEKVATITLNEVDVAKVKVGQKAGLTFDAIDELEIQGTVVAVDLVGSVSQGVVNYDVEIKLDEENDKIRAGMSVSASIEVDKKEGVLTVANSAIKTQGNMTYVEVFNSPIEVGRGTQGSTSAVPPMRKPIEIGITDDTVTEVLSGLNEGDQVVVRTILGSAPATNAATGSLFGGAGSGGAGTRTTTGGGSGQIRMSR